MKNTNRITQRISVYVLLFILIASSIPNIYANTNPEIASLDTAPAPEMAPEAAPEEKNDLFTHDLASIQDPVELQLNILAGMCDHIVDNVEKGTWKLPHDEAEKKLLIEVVVQTFNNVACEFLKTFKKKKPDITMQVFCEIIIRHQLEYINNLLLRNNIPEANLEEEIKIAQEKKHTVEDLAEAITQAYTALEALHTTLQSLESPDGIGGHTKKEKSALDRTNDQVLKQLCAVDTILEEQAQFIDSDHLKVSDKATAREAIMKVRDIIEKLKYDRDEVTHTSIYNLLALNKYLIGYVQTMIQKNFSDLPVIIDKNELVTRTKRDVTPEELDEKYQDNEKILIELRQHSQLAGLKRYHVLFRTIEPYWTKTLDGGRRIAWPILVGGLVTLALQQSDLLPTWFDFKLPGVKMPDGSPMYFYGDRWSAKIENGALVKPDPSAGGRIGLVSNLYHGVTPFVSNALVLSVGGLAALYGMSDFKLMKNATHDLITRTGNFLLGKKAVKKSTLLTFMEPKYTFKDVIGQQEIKDKLSIIVRYFEDPQGIDNRGLKLEKGYLFTGKTRSGKSFMAEALAGEIRAALKRAGKDEKTLTFLVAPQHLLRQSGGFEVCMEHAKRYAPCILFIDEIHLLELQTGKNNALLNEFLTKLSGFDSDPDAKVFVIAATNQEDALDKPLREGGRLSAEIRFEYPTYADRRTFIVNILEKRTINVQSDKWARAINQFARESENRTFEDLRKTIEAAFIDAKFNGISIEPEHLGQSFDKNIRGILFTHDLEVSRQEREIVASHQAGYVLATKILAPYLSIAKVTTLPIRESIKERSIYSEKKADDANSERIVYGRMFTYGNKNFDALRTTQEHINACAIALAGYAAGNVILGRPNNSTSYLAEKRQEAFDIAKSAVIKGINIDGFDDSFKHEFLKRSMAFRNACDAKAATLMEQNKEALNALYVALLKRETLTEKEINAILAQHKIVSIDQDENILNIIDTASLQLAA